MKITQPRFEIMTPISQNGAHELVELENIARICYKSVPRLRNDETPEEENHRFIRSLIARGHEAMLEHSRLTVYFVCDRGISHELVRHRMASFAQESTRWCNYSRAEFGNEITFIRPSYLRVNENGDAAGEYEWTMAMMQAEEAYFNMLSEGYSAQEARAVLPNSLKTEIVVTANYREWRHILRLRTAPDAHPQMRELMVPLLEELKRRIPVIFDDIGVMNNDG